MAFSNIIPLEYVEARVQLVLFISASNKQKVKLIILIHGCP
jgi:hypothetical protein